MTELISSVIFILILASPLRLERRTTVLETVILPLNYRPTDTFVSVAVIVGERGGFGN